MSQSISRRSFLKCAGSGAVSLAAALLTGVCAAETALQKAQEYLELYPEDKTVKKELAFLKTRV